MHAQFHRRSLSSVSPIEPLFHMIDQTADVARPQGLRLPAADGSNTAPCVRLRTQPWNFRYQQQPFRREKFRQLVTIKRPHNMKSRPTISRKEIVSPNSMAPSNGVSANASATNGYARDNGVKLKIHTHSIAYPA